MTQIQVGDIEIGVDELPGDGPPIVLVMGLGAQMLLWPEPFCAALAEAGHRVIRYDNRDVGLSTRLHHLGVPSVPTTYVRRRLRLPVRSGYSLADMAADGVGVLDALGIERACFVGASMGGMIVQRVAIHHPERTAGIVSIMSSPSAPKPHTNALLALLKKPGPGREGYLENFVHTFRVIGSQTHPAPEDELRALAAACWERDPSPDGFARHLAAILAEPSRADALAASDVPGLVVHGAQDPLIPLSYGIETAKLLRARLEVYAEMAHDLPPVIWDDLVRSISRHATSAAAR
ncbi:MAG: alpha/beta hydrolase [Alphaproteobacteria bacterium]|nr:alpha/beta hydrolase [Alphaproteobacteria bacterium]